MLHLHLGSAGRYRDLDEAQIVAADRHGHAAGASEPQGRVGDGQRRPALPRFEEYRDAPSLEPDRLGLAERRRQGEDYERSYAGSVLNELILWDKRPSTRVLL